MEAIREYLIVDDSTLTPLERRQLRAINTLGFSTVVTIVFLFLLTILGNLEQPLQGIVLSSLVLGPIILWATHYLTQRKHFAAASVIFVVYYVLMMAGITLGTTLAGDTPTGLTLVLPIVLTGMLLERRGVIIVTGGMVFLLITISLLQRYVWLLPSSMDESLFGNSLLVILAGATTAFLVNELVESYDIVRQEEDNLDTVLHISRQIAVHTSENGLLQDFGTTMQNAFGLQQVQIFLREPDNPGILNLRSGAGLATQRALGRTLSIEEETILTMALHTAEPVIARASDMAYLQTELLPGSSAQLIVPIYSQDNMRGVVDFQSADEWYFTERQIALFQAITFEFSTVLNNLMLAAHNETVRGERDDLYAKVAAYQPEIMHLRRQVAGVVWDRFFQEQESEVLGFDLPSGMTEPVANNTLSNSMATTLTAGAVDVRKTDNGYLLALPIVLRGQVLGALEFNIVRETDLPDHVIDLATTITERLSLALDNARLMQETQAFAYREQQISGVATELQGAATMEDLLALAAEQLNNVLGSSRTRINLQLAGKPTKQIPTGSDDAAANGGGAA